MVTNKLPAARILVAGIGNIFLGDDAFGVEVVHALSGRSWPPEVEIRDFGIRGFDLARALVEGYTLAVLVDAVPHGGAPGTVYTIEAEQPAAALSSSLDLHDLDPASVLRLAATMGDPVRRVVVVGCEPAAMGSLEDVDFQAGLSPAVAAAVQEASAVIEMLINRELKGFLQGIQA